MRRSVGSRKSAMWSCWGVSVRWVLAIAWLVTVLFTRSASADDEIARPRDAAAREKLTAGTRLYRLREFDKAIEEYKAGALKEDAPVFYYNLGQCYRQLGRYEDAIWHYQRFLDRANPPPPKFKAAVEMFIRDMKAELEKRAMTRQPTEPVEGKAPIDTKPASATPVPTSVATAVERPNPWYADAFGWGLTGVGIVGTSVAVYLLLDARSLQDEANRESSQATQDELRERAGDRRLAGAIVGIAGLGALVTGVVKLAITDKPREHSVTSGLGLGFTRTGIAITGRF